MRRREARRVLLVDPSGRGGIAAHTAAICEALVEVGAHPELLASRELPRSDESYAVWRWLPRTRWGRPERAGPGFYTRRLFEWAASALCATGAGAARRPYAIDFQAQLNRRFDAWLVHRLRRFAPVVWTVHDVLPFDRTEADSGRYAAIYRAADLVIAHSLPAADATRLLADVDPVVIEHMPPKGGERFESSEARRRLGLLPDGRVLGALGFVRAYKGYDLLAATWERLGSEAPVLLVMGELFDSDQEPVLERLRRTGRAEMRIGYATEEELRLAFSAVDAILLPHSEASPSGMAAMARALGVPVIASDLPEFADPLLATGADKVVPRTAEAWAEAVSGELPNSRQVSRDPAELAARHVEAYDEARRRWSHDRVRGTEPSRPSRAPAPALRLATYTDAPALGGAESSLALLLGGMGDDVAVTVVGTEPSVVEWIAEQRDGTQTVLVPPVRNKWDVWPILVHLRVMRALDPDILHANLWMPWSCQYGITAGLLTRGVRVIAVEHGFAPPTAGLQRRLKWLASLWLRAHVAVGEELARKVESAAGLPRCLIRPIHNAVPDRTATAAPRPVDGPIVGSVGRLSHEKGHDVMVRALQELPDVTAVLVGRGPERDRLLGLAEDLGVGSRVIMPGFIDNQLSWLLFFDVFVLPSRSEGFPLTILEAMLAERPIVATDVGGVREALTDGETGLVVPADDPVALSGAIHTLLTDAALSRRLGTTARKVALERFRPEAMVTAYRSLYDEVMMNAGEVDR